MWRRAEHVVTQMNSLEFKGVRYMPKALGGFLGGKTGLVLFFVIIVPCLCLFGVPGGVPRGGPRGTPWGGSPGGGSPEVLQRS